MPIETWQGSNPYYLRVTRVSGFRECIDLDRHGWMADKGHLLKETPVTVELIRKADSRPVVRMYVPSGMEAYYAARHMRSTRMPEEVVVFGVGQRPGPQRSVEEDEPFREDVLWVLPDGSVCRSPDAEWFGLKQGFG